MLLTHLPSGTHWLSFMNQCAEGPSSLHAGYFRSSVQGGSWMLAPSQLLSNKDGCTLDNLLVHDRATESLRRSHLRDYLESSINLLSMFLDCERKPQGHTGAGKNAAWIQTRALLAVRWKCQPLHTMRLANRRVNRRIFSSVLRLVMSCPGEVLPPGERRR